MGYSYDAAGNMTHDASVGYGYDGAGRMISTNNGSTPAAYTYFGALRIKKVVGATTTITIYSGTQPIAEYAAGAALGSPLNEYLYSGSSLLVTLTGSMVTYHHPDHLSNRAETNSSGTTTRTYGHFPFGETWYETGTADKWKFTNYGRDTGESLLDYASFRYYGSGLGRFGSPDLLKGDLSNPESLNRYSYVLNNPVSFFDPLGLQCNQFISVDVSPGGTSWDFGGVSCSGGDSGGPGGAGNRTPELPGPNDDGGGSGAGGKKDKKSTIEDLRLQLWLALMSDPDCLTFLTGRSGGVLSVLDVIPITVQNIGPADRSAHTVEELRLDSLAPQDPKIEINSEGFFFVQGLSTLMGQQTVRTGTPLYQATTLLQELGHATGALPDDENSTQTSDQNTDRLMEHCKKALSSFPNE